MNGRIMVALEDSPRAADVFEASAELAHALGFGLCAVHVRPWTGPVRLRNLADFPFGPSGVDCLDSPPEIPEDVPLERMVINATEVSKGLLEAAAQLQVELVVLETHGREGLNRLLEGSISERVLRLAPCPTLLLRRGMTLPPLPIQHILVPIPADGGDERALVTAVRLAQTLGAKLTLLMVLVHSAASYSAVYESHRSGDRVQEYENWRLEGNQRLEAAREYARAMGGPALRLQSKLLDTFDQSIASKILRFAQEQQTHLIVMNTTCKRGLERMMLGSVAEGVFHHAHIPVLLVGPQSGPLELNQNIPLETRETPTLPPVMPL
jgi:nucleotide-binding universal stress UspA family protein